MQRRMSAILAADAVSFSAMVGRDEMLAIRTLKGHVEAASLALAQHQGRIFKHTGDGFLAEFASVVDAVSCADAFQKLMADRNRDQPEDLRLLFRVGVHAGDVVVDGDDLLGDGVNVASRLEGIAPPGGVAASARVYEDVVGKLDLSFEDAGERTLKNIARPVRVYTLGARLAPALRAAQELPDKPSVVVLPFANMSRADEDDYFADGVTEDITTALAHIPSIFVIARNSAFSYKGLAIDVRKVGRDLGVRYVLEGGVRRAGRRLRVTGQLVDAETGGQLWAEKFDGEVEDVFDLQDRVSAEVVAAIAPEIQTAEIQRGLRKPVDDLTAYDLYLRGMHALNLGQIGEAGARFEEAIDIAPGYAKPMAIRGWLTTAAHLYGFEQEGDALQHGLDLAEEALRLAPTDAEVLAFAGYTIGFNTGDYEVSLSRLAEATRLSPSFAWAWVSQSVLASMSGRPDDAIAFADMGLRLSPRDPMAFRAYMGKALAYMQTEDWESMLPIVKQGAALSPDAAAFQRYFAIAYAGLDRTDEAKEAADRLVMRMPSFTVSSFVGFVREAGVCEELLTITSKMLLKAGAPE